MARRNKNLAGFNEVGSDNENIKDDVNNDANKNGQAPKDDQEETGTLDKVLSAPKGKKANSTYDKVVVGFHIEKELAAILDDLQRKGGKGVKSQIVNELLEKAFKERGLL